MQLVYLCPAVRKPVGGVKVIYNQAALANRLLADGHDACILHPNTWRHVDPWFDNGVPQMRAWFKPRWVRKPSFSDIRGVFHPHKHCVVIPELWVRKFGTQLIDLKIPFAIFVQAGYYIDKGIRSDLERSYAKAKAILVVSQDTANCVETAFPGSRDRIIHIHPAIDHHQFTPSSKKLNIVAYLDHKNVEQARKFKFFAHNQLPAGWSIRELGRMSPEELANQLSQSKIFLSFQFQEGLGLPPLEAALCGNRVIGYTGQGGKDYWRPEIFDEIENGNVLRMAAMVAKRCADWDHSDQLPSMQNAITALAKTYSQEQQERDVRKFLDRMGLSTVA